MAITPETVAEKQREMFNKEVKWFEEQIDQRLVAIYTRDAPVFYSISDRTRLDQICDALVDNYTAAGWKVSCERSMDGGVTLKFREA